MLRPLRKANAETRRVFNKALKTEAHSYIYMYISYINITELSNEHRQLTATFAKCTLHE